MPIDFPNSPSLNQVFTDTASGKSWIWDSQKWVSYTNTASNTFFVPTGSITTHAGINAPVGWLMCNGQSYLRTQHPALYAVILITYGAGSSTDSTTFNVPDLRNRFVAGIGTQVGAPTWSDTLNEKGGNPDAVVVNHQHSIAHGHTGSVTGGFHSHTIDHGHLSSAGGLSGTHGHQQRFLRTGAGTGTSSFGHPWPNTLDVTKAQLTSGSDGGHSHARSVSDLPNTSSSAVESPTHTHGLNIGGSNTTNSGFFGVLAANANLPPYIVLNYIIKT